MFDLAAGIADEPVKITLSEVDGIAMHVNAVRSEDNALRYRCKAGYTCMVPYNAMVDFGTRGNFTAGVNQARATDDGTFFNDGRPTNVDGPLNISLRIDADIAANPYTWANLFARHGEAIDLTA